MNVGPSPGIISYQGRTDQKKHCHNSIEDHHLQCNFKKVTAFYELCFGFYIREQGTLGIQKWQTEDQKNQEQYAAFYSWYKHVPSWVWAFACIKQWHANSVYQPVAVVQNVGTAQKDVSRKNSERVASFLPFFPLALWVRAALLYLNAWGTFYRHFLQ